IPAQPQGNIGEVIIPPSPPRLNLVGIAQLLGKTLSLQRKAKEETPLSLEGQGVGQEMSLLGIQTPPPASTAKLVLEVYNGNSLIGAPQEQYVTQAGETMWEELSIGMVLPANTTSVVAYMKYESGTDVFFDDLKIELNATPVAMVVQENHYYPFGLNMKGLDYTAPSPNRENKFTFNDGSEKETKLGLHWFETDFRSYDPQIGRFWQIDLLADFFENVSPYVYVLNNPILYNDPTGLCPECETNVKDPKKGQTYVSEGGALYTFDGKQWTREGGMMAEVVVTEEKEETNEKDKDTEDKKYRGIDVKLSVDNEVDGDTPDDDKKINLNPIKVIGIGITTLYVTAKQIPQKIWNKLGLEYLKTNARANQLKRQLMDKALKEMEKRFGNKKLYNKLKKSKLIKSAEPFIKEFYDEDIDFIRKTFDKILKEYEDEIGELPENIEPIVPDKKKPK
ncbi:MAG: hypothetical protein MUE81_10425, partial [Thermoflexibacter sp.]|nr:hypothetical protein [Thermoflexibacter sp.]